ncbi:hypothetical protein Tco_0309700, partial [Tanacetum coccineum]
MEISIADQIALDDALVAPADRLKIGKCNLRLSSDVTSKEATLQVVYDVLKLTPFYKAFQVTADAPVIYMQDSISDGTLDDVRNALNDRLKGIRIEYLPQTFWSQRDKANARAMIQAIDKRLKTRRIMRSLERFVGGRPYGDDLRLLQRT